MDGDSAIECSNQRGKGARESTIWIQQKNEHANVRPDQRGLCNMVNRQNLKGNVSRASNKHEVPRPPQHAGNGKILRKRIAAAPKTDETW